MAESAGNRVTLENYARLHEEGAVGVLDPIYYFQMYGPASRPTQTWHHYWTTIATPVVNPITMVYG